MIRRPPRSTQSRSSAASDVYKRQPDTDLLRVKVGQEDPRLFLFRGPDDHQRPFAPLVPTAECPTRSDPGVAWPRHQATGDLPGRADWLEGARVLQSQERVPAEVTDPLEESAAPQAAIGQHQHLHR